MKRVIKCNLLIGNSEFPHKMKYKTNGKEYYIYYTDPDYESRHIQGIRVKIFQDRPHMHTTSYHDKSYYCIAFQTGNSVEFLRNMNDVGEMEVPSYDPDIYESVEEYIKDIADPICDELDELDKDVKPQLVYYR